MSLKSISLFFHPANTEEAHKLDANEILLDNKICCPPVAGCLWSSHPRVLLKA